MLGKQKVKLVKPGKTDFLMKSAKSSDKKASLKAQKFGANARDFKKSKLTALQGKGALGLLNDQSVKKQKVKLQEKELKPIKSNSSKVADKPAIGTASISKVLDNDDDSSDEDEGNYDEFFDDYTDEDDDSDNYDEDSIDEELSDESFDFLQIEKEMKASKQLAKSLSEEVAKPKSILKTSTSPKASEMKLSNTMAKKGNSSATFDTVAVKANQKKNDSGPVVSKEEAKKPIKASTPTSSAVSAPPITKVSKPTDLEPQTAKASEKLTLIATPGAENLTASQREEFDRRVRNVEKCTVFLKGLHRRCTETDLRRIVKDVITIRLPLHAKKGSQNGRNRGFAFLEFADEQTARRNINFLNKEAKLLNSEGQPCKLEANVSGDRGHAMSADDWNIGSLYIAGLPEGVGEDEIAALFDRQQVVAVALPRKRSNENRGSAHVRFKSIDVSFRQFDAARAKLMRRQFVLRGRLLSIAFSSLKTLKQHGQQKHPQQAADSKNTPSKSSPTTAVATATTTVKKPAVTNPIQGSKNANDPAPKKVTKPTTFAAIPKAGLKRKLDEDTQIKPKALKQSIKHNLLDDADDSEDEDDDDDSDIDYDDEDSD